MRLRSTTAILALILAVVLGYALWWQAAAKRAVRILDKVVDQQRLAGLTIDYHGPYLDGFPLRLGLLVRDLTVHDRQDRVLTAAEVEAAAPVWDPTDVLLTFKRTALSLPLDTARATLSAPEGRGRIKVETAAGSAPADEVAELGLIHPHLALGGSAYDAATLRLRLNRPGQALPRQALPKQALGDHLAPGLAVNLDASAITVPAVRGLGDRIDNLALTARWMGPLPQPFDASTLAAWNQAGGTVEIDRLALTWGGLGISANATLTLDKDLQPLMAGSADITGYEVLIDGMVAAGRLRENEANITKMALALMAHPGVGGESTMRVPLGIQNHTLTLGPLSVAAVPTVQWR